jgi:hypothetical protein
MSIDRSSLKDARLEFSKILLIVILYNTCFKKRFRGILKQKIWRFALRRWNHPEGNWFGHKKIPVC